MVEQRQKELDAARGALLASREAVATAQLAFDESGSESSLKSLTKARDGEAVASEHVARAERLLEKAQRDEDQLRKKALEREREKLESELSHSKVETITNALNKRRRAAIEQLAAINTEAAKVAGEHNARSARLRVVLAELGIRLGEAFQDEDGRQRTGHTVKDWGLDITSLRRTMEELRESAGLRNVDADDSPHRREMRFLVGALLESLATHRPITHAKAHEVSK